MSQRVLKVLGILTSPLILILLLFVLNAFNPMQWVFLFSFEVKDNSNQTIWITPIGSIGFEGKKSRLPVFLNEVPAIPAIVYGGYRLDPGDSKTIVYDWDDINFSDIVVKDKSGEYRSLIVNPNPTERMYSTPTTNTFNIESWNSLTIADSRLVDIARGWNINWWGIFLYLGWLIPVTCFYMVSRIGKTSPNKNLFGTSAVQSAKS